MSQRRYINRTVERKIFTADKWEELDERLYEYRKVKQSIVLTCGCFDVLHVGHARLLRDAADLGNILVVGLNSDSSIRRLKGEGRPIVGGDERVEMVASLEGVTFVTHFDEDEPSALIRAVQPDIYVKGGDYASQHLPEAPVVTENGGQVLFLTYHSGYSTTSLLGRLKGLG